MMTQQLLGKLKDLKLTGMAEALSSNFDKPAFHGLSFDEQMGILIDCELSSRDTKRMGRLLSLAKFRYPNACLENLDYRTTRGLDKNLFSVLAACDWVRKGAHIVIDGATGTGKSWVACALGMQACRNGFSVIYRTSSQLAEEIILAIENGSLPLLKAKYIKASIVMIDDLGIMPFDQKIARALLDIVDERERLETGSFVITSQYPPERWHAFLGDPTTADAVMDRLVHTAHSISLKGESLRKQKAPKK
ncbi:IS21-like element helper ATPase IstB [Methylophilus sp.]|uniref:IS21-like element helper ATPase IstB n=1 Tax=Methylophilus sp. TaxID=29541 RepID=UPI000D4E9CE2|nr:IS21-like element helper ATPase IstB [Methylophilus sp.]PPD11479.1 MAG: AAA family ATPase [Methylophilus sp.]